LNAPVIKLPDCGNPFELISKASDSVVGPTLGQRDGNNFNIIHHASRTLNEAQRNYSLAEQELFAVVFSCDKFISYVSDSNVKVHTDYNILKEILEKTNVKPRMIRWTLLLQEFELQIVQTKEEEPKPPEQETIAICIPEGTIEGARKEGKRCCEGIDDIPRKIMFMQRRKVPRRFGNIISST
jgi:hypothetical protein